LNNVQEVNPEKEKKYLNIFVYDRNKVENALKDIKLAADNHAKEINELLSGQIFAVPKRSKIAADILLDGGIIESRVIEESYLKKIVSDELTMSDDILTKLNSIEETFRPIREKIKQLDEQSKQVVFPTDLDTLTRELYKSVQINVSNLRMYDLVSGQIKYLRSFIEKDTVSQRSSVF